MPIPSWTCDICGCRFDRPEKAEACEARGSGVHPENIPPRGLVISENSSRGVALSESSRGFIEGGNHHGPLRGDRFCGVATGKVGGFGHFRAARWHWFRGNGLGDDPWFYADKPSEEGGRFDVIGSSWRGQGDTYLEAPAVKRAIQACREHGVDPLILRGGEIVRLDDIEEGER